jgi:hypothetical protein
MKHKTGAKVVHQWTKMKQTENDWGKKIPNEIKYFMVN